MQQCQCHRPCTMTAPYWASIVAFAKATRHRLMFGLLPDASNAASLVYHAVHRNHTVAAYTFGNELDSP